MRRKELRLSLEKYHLLKEVEKHQEEKPEKEIEVERHGRKLRSTWSKN